jgi:hypothetical protein
MINMKLLQTLIVTAMLMVGTMTSHAAVYFQNTGLKKGWSTANPQSGTKGRIVEVTSPTYKGKTAIMYEQTFFGEHRGYHSECTVAKAISNNQDKYFGQAIYFPANWEVINKNATFQQFSPENPAGPWILNFREGNRLYIGGQGNRDLGGCTNGVWIRVVVRLQTKDPGVLAVWVNGERKLNDTDGSLPGRKGYTIHRGSPTARWSVGLYVTWWRDPRVPVGQKVRQLYQDHFRIASSYAEADPANWTE